MIEGIIAGTIVLIFGGIFVVYFDKWKKEMEQEDEKNIK